MFLLLVSIPQVVSANSSWIWISETRPYDLLPIVIILTLLNHQKSIELTYDNLLFLINRIEMNNQELRNMESESTKKMLDNFLV